MKIIIAFTILLVAISAVAQRSKARNKRSPLKELTLKDAVLGQKGFLAPKDPFKKVHWNNFNDNYYYPEGDSAEQVLRVGSVKLNEISGDVSLVDLNNALSQNDVETLKKLPEINWISKNEFIFKSKAFTLKYNLSKKKITKLFACDTAAENGVLSPSKQAFAYTVDNNVYVTSASGTKQITRSKNKKIVNGASVHRFEFGISKGIFWSPKSKRVGFYRKDESMVTEYPLVDISTKPASVKTIVYPMAGNASHQVTFGIYDLKSDKTIWLNTGGDPEHYLTNIAWSPDEKSIFIAELNRDQNYLRFNQYDAATGNLIKTLFEEKDDEFIQPLKPMVFVKNKSDEFLWISDRDGYKQIFHYNIDGKLIKKITEVNWVVKEIVGFDNSGSNVIFLGTGPDGTETNIYKANMSSGKITQINKLNGTHSVKLNNDGSLLIDSYSSVSIPKQSEIIDLSGNVLKLLNISEYPLKGYQVCRTELFTLKSENNLDLYCRMIKPHDFDENKKYPVLVYVYGGPGVQLITNSWLADARLWMHYMANKGYIIFTMDNRGSSNRGQEFEQATFRDLGTIEITDQLVGVDYLKTLKYVNKDKMAVHGWSYGGFMTTSLMLRSPGTFKVGVAGGPVIDWKYYEIMYTERYMDTPQTNPKGYANASLLEKVKNLEGSLMLIHGAVDDVVVWQHSLDFVKKCVDNEVQLDYFVYPGHPHNVRGKDRVHLMQKILDYIDAKLK